MIIAHLISKSAVQYMKHFIYHFTSILHGLIRTQKWPAPNISGFIAQLVRASHWYREVTGLNPVEVLTFSRPQPLFLLRAGRMPLYLLSYGSTALSASSFNISLFFLVLHQRVNPAKQPWLHAFLLWSHHIRLYFFNPQQILLRDRLTTQVKKKHETLIQNLQQNNIAQQVYLGFCISYFAAFIGFTT